MGHLLQHCATLSCRVSMVSLVCLALSACAGLERFKGPNWPSESSRGSSAIVQSTAVPSATVSLQPRIVNASQQLQCVPYAREHAGIEIRGDAWTWWGQAEGRYQRGQRPEVGSLLVLRRRGRSRGHLAVVTEIVDSRTIVVRHANWLNRGRIHLDTPVRDVSRGNDWSAVRVWYTPGGVYGATTYPAYGFIYPRTETAVR